MNIAAKGDGLTARILSPMASRLLKLGFCVVLGAVFLRYLVRRFEDPSPLTSQSANEDLLSHVPLDEDLAEFIEQFETPPGQYIVKVSICRQGA